MHLCLLLASLLSLPSAAVGAPLHGIDDNFEIINLGSGNGETVADRDAVEVTPDIDIVLEMSGDGPSNWPSRQPGDIIMASLMAEVLAGNSTFIEAVLLNEHDDMPRTIVDDTIMSDTELMDYSYGHDDEDPNTLDSETTNNGDTVTLELESSDNDTFTIKSAPTGADLIATEYKLKNEDLVLPKSEPTKKEITTHQYQATEEYTTTPEYQPTDKATTTKKYQPTYKDADQDTTTPVSQSADKDITAPISQSADKDITAPVSQSAQKDITTHVSQSADKDMTTPVSQSADEDTTTPEYQSTYKDADQDTTTPVSQSTDKDRTTPVSQSADEDTTTPKYQPKDEEITVAKSDLKDGAIVTTEFHPKDLGLDAVINEVENTAEPISKEDPIVYYYYVENYNADNKEDKTSVDVANREKTTTETTPMSKPTDRHKDVKAAKSAPQRKVTTIPRRKFRGRLRHRVATTAEPATTMPFRGPVITDPPCGDRPSIRIIWRT